MPTKLKIAFTVLMSFVVPICDAKSQFKDEIAVRIALPQESVCMDSKSIRLELYVTNAGQSDFSIAREWMISNIDYEVVYDVKQGFGRAGVFGQHGDPISEIDFSKGTPIKLAAGSAQYYEMEKPLDNAFFQKPGFYKVSVRYRGAIREKNGTIRKVRVSSNWVLFEIDSCRSKATK